MPPGISHPNYVSWDDLDVWSQAKLIEFHRVQCYLEAGGDEAKKIKSSPPPRPRRR